MRKKEYCKGKKIEMIRKREENISCFLSYEGCIFNDVNMCTSSYPERREDIWIGRALYNGEKKMVKAVGDQI